MNIRFESLCRVKELTKDLYRCSNSNSNATKSTATNGNEIDSDNLLDDNPAPKLEGKKRVICDVNNNKFENEITNYHHNNQRNKLCINNSPISVSSDNNIQISSSTKSSYNLILRYARVMHFIQTQFCMFPSLQQKESESILDRYNYNMIFNKRNSHSDINSVVENNDNNNNDNYEELNNKIYNGSNIAETLLPNDSNSMNPISPVNNDTNYNYLNNSNLQTSIALDDFVDLSDDSDMDDNGIPTSTDNIIDLTTTNSSSINHPSIQQSIKFARVVRIEGATVRDGISIDNSNIITRLPYNTIVSFDLMETLYPDVNEHDDIPVLRLRINVQIDSHVIVGWASLSGRTKTDSKAIMEILSQDSNNTSELQAKNAASANDSVVRKQSESGGEIQSLSFCPFCGEALGNYLSEMQKRAHLAECIDM